MSFAASAGRNANRLNISVGTYSISANLAQAGNHFVRQFTQLYAHYPVLDNDAPTDLSVTLKGCRRWNPLAARQVQVEINGEQPFDPMSASFSLPMMETGLNWFIARYSTSRLLFHAAVVARDDRAILLPGESGAGKSTLCAALMADGWRLLSDEFAMLAPEDGRIYPHPRPISLKEKSIDIVGKLMPTAYFSEPVDGTTKGRITYLRPPKAMIGDVRKPARPVSVIFPRYQADGRGAMTPVARADGFMRLVDLSANYFTLMEVGFETLARLVTDCAFYDFTYCDLDQAVSRISAIHAQP